MFDAPELGSAKRFESRMAKNPHPASKIRHLGWWVVHNVVSHPLIGLLPFRWAFDFHDWTSVKLNSHPHRK